MKDYDLAQLLDLVNQHVKDQHGVWVRLKDDFTICLVGVADANTGEFISAFLPCARNSRRYKTPFSDIRELETEGATEAATLRLARIADNGAQPGAGWATADR